MAYQIKLPQFEGPFDLLLFFIERDELDIYNIPIHSLIQDFLAYIHQLEALDIELASEFILFVSTLMRIKAKMLLPRRELDATGNEIDPRQELVDKILEYKRFKEASETMAGLEAERLLAQKRGNIRAELEAVSEAHSEGTEVQTITVYKLAQTFEKLLKRLKERTDKPQHVVVKYNYSLEGQRSFLIDHLSQAGRLSFEALFTQAENRIHAIFTFLAMLELIQQRFLSILSGTGRNNFILEWNENREAEASPTS
ncbi:MAG: segregation/condensation protein A [Bacteroidetes bacterium]|nr:segregation/condensation protein A [Bacteroidota bacterium]MBS1629490.1 segregation/condensation protein A [Bacteroidota bacterium]